MKNDDIRQELDVRGIQTVKVQQETENEETRGTSQEKWIQNITEAIG